jgi:nucleotide-binding universal stress UspA family protein
MIDIRAILCPIDFSEYSRHALDHALALARRYDSRITLLYVYAIPPLAAYGLEPPLVDALVLTSADRERLRLDMQRFVESETTGDVPVDIVIDEGNPTSCILNQADAMPADVLVVGTHGRSGFQRLVLGSVTEKVLRQASCPVLSVPPRVPDAVPAAPVLFKRVLCATDFSDCSMHALNYAVSIAQEADAHLTVLHVMQYDMEEITPEMRSVIADERLSVTAFRRRCTEHSLQRLRDAVPDAVLQYCTVETLVSDGKPYREILRVAATQHSDLIVIGVHGRGPADLMFFGSTTQHVVRHATCPVLTLRTG